MFEAARARSPAANTPGWDVCWAVSTLTSRPTGVSVMSQPRVSAKGLATRTAAPTKMAFSGTNRPSVRRAPGPPPTS